MGEITNSLWVTTAQARAPLGYSAAPAGGGGQDSDPTPPNSRTGCRSEAGEVAIESVQQVLLNNF